ncbi:hypothetical protein B296_00046940 [Ensete ventricosum]|uniref:VHS domain-containing protein n=1 Tax=Ensete ventricosum TaxID=4639 RepID=A0A426Z1R1_ENSVE|nr:hypothetical protein B296_00046940 [Ensete ventricosum]
MSSAAAATVRVEKATSDLLMGPDWTLNMDICDSVNSDHCSNFASFCQGFYSWMVYCHGRFDFGLNSQA